MPMDSLEAFCLWRREYRLATRYPRAAGRPAERRGRNRGPRGPQGQVLGLDHGGGRCWVRTSDLLLVREN